MNTDFPKVTLPDVTDEQRAEVEGILTEVEEQAAHVHRQQVGVILAMWRLKKPIARKGKTPRKARKVTKHSRYAATMTRRSSFIKLDAAMADYAENTTPGGTWVEGAA